jgi:predicted phage terminase large subunit-like protein
LQPGLAFQDNWHIHAMCEHLEAVSSGQIKRLIINVPFRSLKSTICSVAFPAWEWGPRARSELSYLTSSYAMKVSTRDAVDTRRVIESPLYQRYWGHVFELVGDQNEKTRYENDKRGMRTVTSTDSAGTGFGGNRIIVDDPISAKLANSPVEIEASIEWWRGTGATRLNDPERDAIVLVHQRLAPRDLTGHMLAEEKGWEHLVLPMRYSREHAKTTSLGFVDPRKRDGELLFPKRVGEAACTALERTLGAYNTAAQLDQRPSNRQGLVFDPDKMQVRQYAPLGMKVTAGWDIAGTDPKDDQRQEGVAWTVRVLMGQCQDGSFGILHVNRIRKEPDQVLAFIKAMSDDDQAKYPSVEISLPLDPGAAGKCTALVMTRMLAGKIVECTPETGDKVTRARPLAAQMAAGNVWMLKGEWNHDYREELRLFPGGAFKDQVDASSRAFLRLAGTQTLDGIIEFFRNEGRSERADAVLAEEFAGYPSHSHTPAPRRPNEDEDEYLARTTTTWWDN